MSAIFAKENKDQAAASAAILPDLNNLDPLLLGAEDRLLILLASAAHFDGKISPEAWRVATGILHEVFDPEEQDCAGCSPSFSSIQAKFHAALLLEPVAPSGFASDKALLNAFSALPKKKAEAFRNGIAELCPAYAVALVVPQKDQGENSPSAKDFFRKNLRLPGVSPSAPAEEGHSVIMDNGLAVSRASDQSVFPAVFKKSLSGLESMAKNAAGPYHWAARYFKEMDVLRLFSQADRQKEPMRVPDAFADTSQAVQALERSALGAGSIDLFQYAADFRHLMQEQPYTVVIVGEGKRGKSSLVNALLGKDVSPVRESVAATATVVKFRWGESFRGRVHYMQDSEKQRLDLLFARKAGEFAASADGEDGGEETGEWVGSAEELKPHLTDSVNGKKRFVSFAEVELPADILRNGTVLVDTPGLNATVDVQNFLAYQASLDADCLVLVMDARRPESASEAELVHLLAGTGRAASLVGVVTGIDRLNEKASADKAMAEARGLLNAASAEGITVIDVLDINAREAMAKRCSVVSWGGGKDFQKLYKLISAGRHENAVPENDLALRVIQKGEELVRMARESAPALLQKEMAAIPDVQHDMFLTSHRDRLRKVLAHSVKQAQNVAASASDDIEAWRREQVRSLDKWEETTVMRIMDAAGKYADQLGSPAMFNAKKWKDFNEHTVVEIAHDSLKELLAERRSLQRDWNEKLRRFSGELREISVHCLDAVMVEDSELTSINEISLSRMQWMVKANDLLKKITLVGAGAALRGIGGAGVGLAIGGLGWWAALPVAIAGGVIWMMRRVGDPQKCRVHFLKAKEESIRSWASKQKKNI
ncbi:MAG: dynamin family protein, partial [Mailhella sp.]|nr:dynamin family protein [Mailhella sp.]